MDHEKPEAVFPQIVEDAGNWSGHDSATVEINPDIEPAPIEAARASPGESLRRVLNERQINMIAFSGAVGNGLFLGSGATLALAGPGGAILCYLFGGIIMSAVISCLGEMTALMPVNAPMIEFPRRFLDRGVGFGVGWMYWFGVGTIGAEELVAATNLIRFHYDDGKTSISWPLGESVDPAVWMCMFLVIIVMINSLPVKYFGQLEYIIGCIKMSFIILLITMMFILNVIKPRANAYYDQKLSTKYWDQPYSFFNHVYNVTNANGNVQRTFTGSTGTFFGMWNGIVNSFFSYTGMELLAATAAESKALPDAESMKMAARKVSIRVVLLYILGVLTASFLVPYNHPFINGGGQSVGAHSLFIIAAVEAGLPGAAHFFNAIFVFSSFCCASGCAYLGSRLLYTLALHGQTGPEFFTRRLRQCNSGVPIRAVLVTSVLMLVGFMGRTGSTGQRLNELATNGTVQYLTMYAVICAAYLNFFWTLEDVKKYNTLSDTQAAIYDRNHPRYPYKSHGQWFKAGYGLVGCTILVLFNGIDAFLEKPFGLRQFITSYIGIPVFLSLILGYKLCKHGLNLSQWGPEKSNDMSGSIQVTSETRKGRLQFPDDGLTRENALTFVNWVWVWLK